MDFTIILKIAAVGIIVAILHQILGKVGREEYGMLVVLSGVVVILLMLIPHILELLDTVQSMLPMALAAQHPACGHLRCSIPPTALLKLSFCYK